MKTNKTKKPDLTKSKRPSPKNIKVVDEYNKHPHNS